MLYVAQWYPVPSQPGTPDFSLRWWKTSKFLPVSCWGLQQHRMHPLLLLNMMTALTRPLKSSVIWQLVCQCWNTTAALFTIASSRLLYKIAESWCRLFCFPGDVLFCKSCCQSELLIKVALLWLKLNNCHFEEESALLSLAFPVIYWAFPEISAVFDSSKHLIVFQATVKSTEETHAHTHTHLLS